MFNFKAYVSTFAYSYIIILHCYQTKWPIKMRRGLLTYFWMYVKFMNGVNALNACYVLCFTSLYVLKLKTTWTWQKCSKLRDEHYRKCDRLWYAQPGVNDSCSAVIIQILNDEPTFGKPVIKLIVVNGNSKYSLTRNNIAQELVTPRLTKLWQTT